MKKILTALTILVALAAVAEAQTVILVNPSAAQANAFRNEADLARFRRQAREEVGDGVATPEQAARMNFVGPLTPAGNGLPPGMGAPQDPAPAPKKAQKANWINDPAANPFAPQTAPSVGSNGREAGRASAMRAGHHAGRMKAAEITRRAKAAAPARLTDEDEAVFVREFLTGFAATVGVR